MAQLRYTRAIACGAFVTAGLVGVYVYKKRRSKKSLDNHKSSEPSQSSCQEINHGKETIENRQTKKNTQISDEVPLKNSPIECDTPELSLKHEPDSLSVIAQGLEDFQFNDDSQNILNEIVEEKCVEESLAPGDEMPVLEPIIVADNGGLTDSGINEDTIEYVTKEIYTEVSESLNWANEVDIIPTENSLDLSSTVGYPPKDKDGFHESDQGSEVNSEGSTDSGRGSTTVIPPTSTNTESDNVPTVYQFEFPTRCVGKMIGKQGRSIKALKEKTGAKIVLEKIPYNKNFQNCIIKGLSSEVEAAIKEIQIKFPDVDVHRVVVESPPAPQPETMVPALQLCDEIVNDVLISNVISACHVFIQQPLHPSFRALPRLQTCMASCYAQLHETPPLPQPVDVGMICVAPINESWCRAQVIAVQADSDEIDVKLVDYGGYARLDQACLRQIRSDFMSLPFQALECYLAHIAPLEGEEVFSDAATMFLDELAQSYSYLEAEVVAYSEDGLPMLEIYFTDRGQRNMINKELVQRGLVSWYEMPSSS